MDSRPPTAFPIVRDIVLVQGADARSYLQTQLTQDVEGLPLAGSAWSFILDPKSSIDALVRVTRIGQERVTLDTEPGHGDAVRARLDGHLFRTDARFSQDTWPGISWIGHGSQDMRSDAPIVSLSAWSGVDGLDIVGPNVPMPADAPIGSSEELYEIRIRSGWPSMDSEISEGVTPAMTRLVERAVSFDKGCYTGQELVARVHHRGAAPTKRLVTISGSEPLPTGAALELDGESVGEITSASSRTGDALGFLIRRVDTPVTLHVGGRTVAVADLPTAPQPSS
jgi:folate-binding protein YgfZ